MVHWKVLLGKQNSLFFLSVCVYLYMCVHMPLNVKLPLNNEMFICEHLNGFPWARFTLPLLHVVCSRVFEDAEGAWPLPNRFHHPVSCWTPTGKHSRCLQEKLIIPAANLTSGCSRVSEPHSSPCRNGHLVFLIFKKREKTF